jgi:hypothetical protein
MSKLPPAAQMREISKIKEKQTVTEMETIVDEFINGQLANQIYSAANSHKLPNNTVNIQVPENVLSNLTLFYKIIIEKLSNLGYAACQYRTPSNRNSIYVCW